MFRRSENKQDDNTRPANVENGEPLDFSARNDAVVKKYFSLFQSGLPHQKALEDAAHAFSLRTEDVLELLNRTTERGERES